MKIGLLDSGIGGLTILKSLLEKCPNHEYVYYGDTLHMPYGEKTRDEIINYGNNIIKFLESLGCDVIIIACGTISSNIEYVKSNVKVIDLLSPMNKKLDNYSEISIMATPLSIKTNAYKKYINTKLNLISCPDLARIIEEKDYDNIDEYLIELLSTTKNSEALILGCTHYPLIKDYISKYFNKKIITFDMFITDIIKELPETNNKLTMYFSKIDNDLNNRVKEILNLDVNLIEKSDLSD